MKIVIWFLVLFVPGVTLSQPEPEWVSPSSDTTEQGWFIIRNNPLEVRFYQQDRSGFRLMSGVYSNTVDKSISFSPPETRAGNLNFDVSGDGLNELVISWGGAVPPPGFPASPFGFKIIDIMNGQTLFTFADSFYSYRLGSPYTPNVSDIDNDGYNELVVLRQSLLSHEYQYLVYQTNGVATSVFETGSNTPKSPSLHQNYPNPFNPNTTISYELTTPGDVGFEIYDISGQLVQTFNSRHQETGSHQVVWNGKNNSGSSASSGVYFYRMIFNGKAFAKKMLLLH